jgi:transposase
MLTVDHYAKIRLAHRDGMSIRELARTFHHSRSKVRQILQEPQPRPYTRSQPSLAPILGPFQPVIDAILQADELAPPKQRHTAAQIHRRLGAEHAFTGGYDPVRRYVARQRRQHRETFIPLAHDPGIRLEADFGHIFVDFPTGRQLVAVLVAAWAYSNYSFALAVPTQRTEAILHGLVEAFGFFGCVPYEVWWDNPTTVVQQIFPGRARKVAPLYAALASHYNFEPLFCMPAKGNEKSYAENRVKVLQKQWAMPVPQVADLAALNCTLRQRCLAEANRTVNGRSESIGQRFLLDQSRALALPAYPFDAAVSQAALVDKYQTVRFDSNHYSVPRHWAYQAVTVKGYVDRVEVVAAGTVVARHSRSYGADQRILDPVHYLAALERRPAALDHAPVLRDWQLPPSFGQLRQALEEQLGLRTGARHYIRVLQLLAEHPLQRVQQAVQRCLARQQPQAERVSALVQSLAQENKASSVVTTECQSEVMPLCQYQVHRPDLGRFDQLLSGGGDADDRCDQSAAAEPSQAAALTDHCGRV